MSERIMVTVDDAIAERIRALAGSSMSGWLAEAARERLDRHIAAAYEEWDVSLSAQDRTELAQWDALPYPEDEAA